MKSFRWKRNKKKALERAKCAKEDAATVIRLQKKKKDGNNSNNNNKQEEMDRLKEDTIRFKEENNTKLKTQVQELEIVKQQQEVKINECEGGIIKCKR
jgi:hypothetical protein